MAATFDPAARNQAFQPGKAKSFKVQRPASARVLGGETRYPAVTVQKITPILSMRSRVEIGKSAVQAPADAAVRPAVVKAAGGS